MRYPPQLRPGEPSQPYEPPGYPFRRTRPWWVLIMRALVVVGVAGLVGLAVLVVVGVVFWSW